MRLYENNRLLHHFSFSVFMTYSLHRKIKFAIAKYFKNMCAPGGK